jgi:formate dehydrogenase iron-sulfur subunit
VQKRVGLLTAAALVVLGLVWNRVNVAVVGMIDLEGDVYFPYWAEIFITLGLISLGILGYRLASLHLPLHEEETAATH